MIDTIQRDRVSAEKSIIMDDPKQMPVSGDESDQFRIIEMIGSGGMSNVYKIFNKPLEVFRAIKIVKPEIPASSAARLEIEAKIIANIRNANVVEIFSSGVWKSKPYIEMEYIDGPSVEDLITKGGPLPPKVALAIIYYVCEALTKAYECNISLYGKQYSKVIHRDIKPSNILITKKGVVKVADFGIARPSETSIHPAQIDRSLLGTPAYVSPEQVNGEHLDQRSDIYSIGAVFYEMLTAEKLFPQEKITELLSKKSNPHYISQKQKRIIAPKRIVSIVQKCLKIERNERFESSIELGNAVKKALLQDKANLAELSSIIEGHISGESLKSAASKQSIATKIGAAFVLVIFVVSLATAYILYNKGADNAAASNEMSIEGDRDTAAFLNDIGIIEGKSESKIEFKKLKPRPVVRNLVKEPVDPISLSEKITTLIKAESYQDLFAVIDTMKDMDSISESNLLTIAQVAIDEGNNELSAKLLIAKEIDDGYYYYLRGRILNQSGDYEGASDYFHKAFITPSQIQFKQKNVYHWAVVRNKMYLSKPSRENRISAEKAAQNYVQMFCEDSTTTECGEVLSFLKAFSDLFSPIASKAGP